MCDIHPAYAVAFAAGVVSHHLLFRFGEWDLATTKILTGFFTLQATTVVALLYEPTFYKKNSLAAFSTALTLGVCALTGLTLSILTYRGFFHRLNKFPGPFSARLSNLYATALSAKKLHLYEEVEKLHKQYGDYVRLGPSELSINDPKAILAIHGPQSKCTKGPWYNVLHPMVSLHMIRNKSEHIRRRKVWDHGFSAKALRDYEPRVAGYTNQLLAHIEKTKGQSVNVTDWFNFYSFDVMGDLAFGKSFGMLKEGIKHYFMTSLHADMTNIGIFSHMLWLFPLFKVTPVLNYEHKRFWKWVYAQVEERKKMKPENPDVFSWLLQDHESRDNVTRQDELDLVGDAYLIVVAGSGTTAVVLTCLFYQLCLNPEVEKVLQKEVDDAFANQPMDSVSLSKLTYLEAVINETLRLHPPVPSGVQRMTPPEGLQIGDTYVPGDTIVQVPFHALFRDERLFARPNGFIPERWTSQPDLVRDASPFVPFSYGRYSCIGKQLGLMEVRYVAAQIVRQYNVGLAPEQRPQTFLDGKRDTFSLALGPLNLVFQPRAEHVAK